MFPPYLKFRTRRAQRKLKRGIIKPVTSVYKSFDRSIVKKWGKFRSAQRFVVTWVALVALLLGGLISQTVAQNNTVIVEVPKPGGRYIEGIVGEFDNLNPLYAVDGANAAASSLVFSGLLEYAVDGQLTGDLAESWSGNEAGDLFTVKLKDSIKWHDGEPLTAADVVFTVNAMKDPAASSPRRSTWDTVRVEAKDELTVEFQLPNAFAPFPHLLRFGILPQHILGDTPLSQLRVAEFNMEPIGSGPFTFTNYDQEESYLLLSQFDDYHEGQPGIRRFELRAYETDSELYQALEEGDIDGYGSMQRIDATETNYNQNKSKLAAGTYLIFNTTRNPLTEASIRQALTQGLNIFSVRNATGEPLPPLKSMFLDDQLSLGDKQIQLEFDPKAADKKLNDAKWLKKGDVQVRSKDGKEFVIELAFAETTMFRAEAENIAQQWQKRGIKVELKGVNPSEFQTTTAIQHDFDVALMSLSNGIDPDVFVFWHSSLSEKGGLNFSGISDTRLDQQLEAGRTRTDIKLRHAKYKVAAERWRTLAPAIGLHQNVYHYIQRSRVKGFKADIISQPKDRFNRIETWTALTQEKSYRQLRSE